MQFLDAMLSCMKSGERCGEQKELAALSDARNAALIAACTAAPDSPACRAEQTKLGDAYWSLTQNDSTYLRWIKDNGLDLAQAALTKGNGGQVASDLLTHTSSLDARYKITCAAAGRCDPFTAGMLALNGKTQEAAANAALNLLFDKVGSGAGVVTNAGGMVMDMAKMNAIYMSIESTKQALNDFQRIGEIGGWGVVKEKGAGAWSSISGYFGNGWDAATYELGLNQKWNLADVAANGFTKGDMGLDVALAVVSLGDVTAMRAAAKARKLAALEREVATNGVEGAKPAVGVKDGTPHSDAPSGDVIGKLEPGNPSSSSLPRFGDRLLIDQGQLPTCGPTSCAMVLDTAGKKVDLGAIIIQSNVRAEGTTMPALAQVLRNNGLSSTRRASVTIEELAKATAKGDPAIVRMSLDRGGHAVVVDGVTMRNGQYVVAIRDPAMGRQYFTPIDEFKRKFSGEAIITSK
ncbi:cysteine peptidase family C39 domain-containing protein [Stenotrophomonas maltophilia]|nr:cysteine peptidase family C39 domain-containing protein [Stenotrophomonas maltophilia]